MSYVVPKSKLCGAGMRAGVRRSGIHSPLGCHSPRGQRRGKKKGDPRGEGGRERELKGRKGSNRNKERARRQVQRTKQETQEREKEEKQNLRGKVGGGKMRDGGCRLWWTWTLGHICAQGAHPSGQPALRSVRRLTDPHLSWGFQDSTPPLASLPEAWVRLLRALPLTAISRAPSPGTPHPGRAITSLFSGGHRDGQKGQDEATARSYMDGNGRETISSLPENDILLVLRRPA